MIFDDIIHCIDCLGSIYVIMKELNSRLLRIDTSNRGIIVTCRSALALSRWLVCFTAAVACIPDARTPQNEGLWRKVVGD